MEKFQLRDYQEKIVDRAVQTIENGRSVVINAPTGTGKTMMTLEVLRRLERTGWVYVRTISQYSSWERDARKLGLSFTGLMRKGEFCKVLKKPYSLFCTYCGEEVEGEDYEHLKKHKKFIEKRYSSPMCLDPNAMGVERFCRHRLEYLTRMFSDQEEVAEFIGKVTTKMEELLKEGGIKHTGNWFRDNEFAFNGDSYDVCVYKLIEGPAWVRIYSYIYFFLNLRAPKEESDDIIVFDEAHNLDDFNINSVTVSKKEILNFFSRINMGEIKKEKILREVEEDFNAFLEDPERGFRHLSMIADEELAQKLITVMKAWEERDSWYIERNAQEGYIKTMPADPSKWLSRLNKYRFILLSGTMPSPDYVKSVWGLTNFESINAMSFFHTTSLRNHFNGAKVFVDDSVYYIKENRSSQRKQVAEEIRSHAVKDGLNLVVLPSYEELEAFKSLFPGAFFEDVRPDVLDRVRGLPNGHLIFSVAGGKLSEGIEVMDETGRSRIKTVFIVGLPIPEYKNPFLEKMIEAVSRRVNKDPKSFKWTVLYEKATIKVRQAVGRAIRGPQDSANIYLLDKRYTYRNVAEKMGLEVYE